MTQLGEEGLGVPLLGNRCRSPSLSPLYIVVVVQCIGFCVAMLPAFSLRFRELAVLSGFDSAETAVAFGRLSAMRSVVEFVATPLLASCSDRIGRRPVLIVISAALCSHFTVLATSDSLFLFSATHVAFGVLSDSSGALAGTCIADATPPGSARAVAFGRLYTVIGAAMVVGPALGGYLANIDGRAPFAVGAALCACSFAYMVWRLPEYFSRKESDKNTETRASSSSVGTGALKILADSPGLAWYMCASALSGMGMGVFGSVQVLWLRAAFGWSGQSMGKFMSSAGLELMVSQSLVLPRLLKLMHGREALLTQFGFVVTGLKLVAYGLAPSGLWLYAAQLIGAVGTCSVAPMRSLCSRCAPESHQGALSGSISATTTAAQIVGSIIGSHVFARSLREHTPMGACLFVGAVCYVLAAACVGHGARVEKRFSQKRTDAREVLVGA